MMPSRLFRPLTNLPSKAGRKLANVIDNPLGEGGRLRGLLAGASEGAGDLLSDMTSPFSIGMQLVGGGGLRRLASLVRPSRNINRSAAPALAETYGRLGPEFAPVGEEAAVNAVRASGLSGARKRLSDVARKGDTQPSIGARYSNELIRNAPIRRSRNPALGYR